MLPLLLLGSLLQSPDLDKKVSVSFPAQRLALSMPLLEKAAGFKLRTTLRTENDILQVSVKEVRLGDLLDRMEEVDGAEWIRRGDALVLERPEKLEANAIQKERETSIAEWKKIISEWSEDAKEPFTEEKARTMAQQLDALSMAADKGGSFESTARPVQEAGERAPMGLALKRLAPLIDLEKVAALGSYRTMVYSTKPNRMQHAFKGDTADILKQYLQEHALWSGVYRKVGRGANRMFGGDPRMDTWQENSKAERLILKVIKRDYIFLSLSAITAEGVALSHFGTAIMRDTDNQKVSEALRKVQEEPDVKFSQRASEHLNHLFGMFPPFKPLPLTREWSERLQRPDKFDPLSFAVSEFLETCAQRSDLQLVAAPRDNSNWAFRSTPKEVNLEAGKRLLESLLKNRFEAKDGWLLVYPESPAEARATRQNRLAGAKFLQSLVSTGRLSLDAAGEFLVDSPPAAEWAFIGDYANALIPDSGLLLTQIDRATCQFWASLLPAERQKLDTGDTVPFSALNPAAKSLLHDMVYFIIDDNEVRRAEGDSGYAGPSEPTEFAPLGLEQTTLTCKTERIPGVLFKDNPGEGYIGWAQLFSVPELARDERAANAKYIPGQLFRRRLALKLRHDLNYTTSLQEADIDLRSERVGLLGLPDEIRKQVEQALKQRTQSGEKPPPPEAKVSSYEFQVSSSKL